MSKKEKRIFILCLILSIFLFLCTAINVVHRQFGGAVAGLGAGLFYFCFAFVTYQKSQKSKEGKQ